MSMSVSHGHTFRVLTIGLLLLHYYIINSLEIIVFKKALQHVGFKLYFPV